MTIKSVQTPTFATNLVNEVSFLARLYDPAAGKARVTLYPLDPACYEVEYSNNIEKGTATVFIHGKGEYGGVKKVTFKITGQKMSWWENIFSS